MAIERINRTEEIMKNAVPVDMEALYKRAHELKEKQEQKEAEERRLEKIRIDNMTCPLCKSNSKAHHVVSNSNGIMGPGHYSSPVMDYYVCKDCGIHYSDLNKK